MRRLKLFVMSIGCAVLMMQVNQQQIGLGIACAADSVTVSSSLLDSFIVQFDSLDMELKIARVNLEKMTALAAESDAASDSFFSKWYVWGGFYVLGVGTGYYIWK